MNISHGKAVASQMWKRVSREHLFLLIAASTWFLFFFFFHCFLRALEAMVVFWGTCTNLLILRYCVRSAVLCKRAGLVTHLKLVLEPSRALCSTVKPWYNEAKWRFYWLASMPGPVHSWQQELLPLHSMCVPRQQYVQVGGRTLRVFQRCPVMCWYHLLCSGLESNSVDSEVHHDAVLHAN